MAVVDNRVSNDSATSDDVMLFGLGLRNISLGQAGDYVIAEARANRKTSVFFINAHCVNVAARDPAYLASLEHATCLFADGSGMAKAARAAQTPFIDNVNGTDLFPMVCERAAKAGVAMALIGAKPGVAAKCAARMMQSYPGLNIAYVRDGFFSDADESALITELNASGAKIVFVARGVPLQEKWIERVMPLAAAPVWLAVGALFDFYSGDVTRAPIVVRRLGLEWLFRLALEPRRLFVRYVIGNPLFMARLWRLRARGVNTLRQARLQ